MGIYKISKKFFCLLAIVAMVEMSFGLTVSEGARELTAIEKIRRDQVVKRYTKDAQAKKIKDLLSAPQYKRNLECYGPTVEIRLKNETVTGGLISVPLISLVNYPLGMLSFNPAQRFDSEDERKKWLRTCQKEPVEVSRLGVSLRIAKSKTGEIYLKPSLVIAPRTVGVGLSPTSEKFPEYTALYGIVNPNGLSPIPEIPKGFVKTKYGLYYNKPGNKDGVGYYMAPSSYLTPRGNRFGFTCSPVVWEGSICKTYYGSKNGVSFKYGFRYLRYGHSLEGVPLDQWIPRDGFPQSQWLYWDRLRREAVEKLIITEEQLQILIRKN